MATPPISSAPRVLNFLLKFVQCVIAALIVGFLALGISMFIPGTWQDGLVNDIKSETGQGVSRNIFAISMFFAVAMLAIYFWVVKLLTKIVGTLVSGDPFVPENISRLRLIWIFIAAAELLRMVFSSNVDWVSPSGVSIDIRVGTWFLVFVIAALAEVFRHGTEMRRDQALTV